MVIGKSLGNSLWEPIYTVNKSVSVSVKKTIVDLIWASVFMSIWNSTDSSVNVRTW